MLPEIEGLRAVAALGIVVTHVAFQTATGHPLLERFDYFVAVFFALSAFLLARGRWRPGYARRRVARIAPAYVVCVSVVLLTLPPLASVGWPQVVANLTLTQLYVPGSLIDGLTHLWSLSTECAFYLVLPAYAALGERWRGRALFASVVFALVWPWLVWGRYDPDVLNLQIWPPSYAPWFAVGLALAELERHGVRFRGPRWPFALAALPVAWFAGVVGPPGLEHPTPAQFNTRIILGTLFAALVVAPYALGPRYGGTLLSSPPMRALGRWSYSIFLWHMSVLYWVFPVLGVPLFGGHFALVLAATLAATVAVAYVSYELIEVPGARWLSSAPKRRSIAPGTAAGTG